jgi:hypothetical protein
VVSQSRDLPAAVTCRGHAGWYRLFRKLYLTLSRAVTGTESTLTVSNNKQSVCVTSNWLLGDDPLLLRESVPHEIIFMNVLLYPLS